MYSVIFNWRTYVVTTGQICRCVCVYVCVLFDRPGKTLDKYYDFSFICEYIFLLCYIMLIREKHE